MSLGTCIGLTDTTLIDDHYGLNHYTGKNIFDGKNYRAILECLNGGYDVAMDLIKSMTERRNLQLNIIDLLISYSNKCYSRLEQQSSLLTYPTTKHAQIQTARAPEKQVEVIKASCDNIQRVIVRYSEQVDEMYPRVHFRTTRKHYQTGEIERSFKNAHSPVRKVSCTLRKLREQREKATDALDKANRECENFSLDESADKNKQTCANDKQGKRQKELNEIETKIVQAEKKLEKQKKIYHEKATVIYKQCQQLEEERLNQIKQTLIDFNQAVHSAEYSNKLDAIYKELISDIKTQQSSKKDLAFWAKTYGVNT